MSLAYIVLILMIVAGFLFGFKKWRKLRITLNIMGFLCIAASFVTLYLMRGVGATLVTSRDAFLYLLIGTGFIMAGLWVKTKKETVKKEVKV